MSRARTGALVALALFGMLLLAEVAVTLAGGPSDVGEHRVASFAFRSLLLAAATGAAIAFTASSAEGRKPALIAAITSYVVVGALFVWQRAGSPIADEEGASRRVFEVFAAYFAVATAVAAALAVTTCWVARRAVGRDAPERALALQTAELTGAREEWGRALRSELASIDDPTDRERFARSSGSLALRRGTGLAPIVLATIAGLTAGLVVTLTARTSLERATDRGLLGEPLFGLVYLVLILGVVTGTLIGRSYRAGLETAVLSWLAVYLCTGAVGVWQALVWYDAEGVLLLDGEGATSHGVGRLEAALQPLTHLAFIVTSVAQLVVAVLAATLGVVVLGVFRSSAFKRGG